MYRTLVLGLCFVASASSICTAQAARVGRLPLLAPLANGATCSITPTHPNLRRMGTARILTINEPSGERLMSVGVSTDWKARMLSVMMSTPDGRRREGESVVVFFGSDGEIARGDRSAYTTGTPARLSDDRRRGLLPMDSAAVRALTRAALRLCRA